MSTRIKIFTFNLRVDAAIDGINRFPCRKDRILSVIAEHSPDIIGFQEANDEMREWLRASLTDYTVIGCGRYGNYRGESTPVAFKTALFDMISYDTQWLSPSPRTPASLYGIDQSGCPRIFVRVLLKHREIDEPFYFYNTHTDHKGATARLLAGMQLIQDISLHKEKFALTGDFNALPGTPEISVYTTALYGRNIIDATVSLGGTFHNFGRKEHPAKIDYIFTDGTPVEAFVIEDKGVEGVFISDHNPVCAVVEF